VISNLRAAVAATKGKKICGLMLDTKGPEIRTGKLVDKKEVDLVAGEFIKVSSDPATIVCERDRKRRDLI
jgi:pyruvate kinase